MCSRGGSGAQLQAAAGRQAERAHTAHIECAATRDDEEDDADADAAASAWVRQLQRAAAAAAVSLSAAVAMARCWTASARAAARTGRNALNMRRM